MIPISMLCTPGEGAEEELEGEDPFLSEAVEEVEDILEQTRSSAGFASSQGRVLSVMNHTPLVIVHI